VEAYQVEGTINDQPPQLNFFTDHNMDLKALVERGDVQFFIEYYRDCINATID
jgi:hypothetical protein